MKQRTAVQREMRGTLSIAVWTVVWTASLALATFGPGELWTSDAMSWSAIGLNVALGVVWIIAHARYLRGVDDLQRKIMLDAIALALGVGLVGGFAYAAADKVGLLAGEPNMSFFFVVMGVVYMVASAIGTLRYR